jgi:hypothetical protein
LQIPTNKMKPGRSVPLPPRHHQTLIPKSNRRPPPHPPPTAPTCREPPPNAPTTLPRSSSTRPRALGAARTRPPATAKMSAGDDIVVSSPIDPPGLSSCFVHCPGLPAEAFAWQPQVTGTDGALLLVSVMFAERRGRGTFTDVFAYRAGGRPPPPPAPLPGSHPLRPCRRPVPRRAPPHRRPPAAVGDVRPEGL